MVCLCSLTHKDDWFSIYLFIFFFFFSSRRRHTRCDCDWSSDVCSSDLLPPLCQRAGDARQVLAERKHPHTVDDDVVTYVVTRGAELVFRIPPVAGAAGAVVEVAAADLSPRPGVLGVAERVGDLRLPPVRVAFVQTDGHAVVDRSGDVG